MKRYICIHGHFYQPPRENAWLEAIEIQDSAYPYHNWNERINAECYAANATSRILNDRGNIIDIVNNYSWISFNFGPTLLAWMEQHSPTVYQRIIAADKTSRQRFSGHGSALAQPYNHMIMPLASSRDKITQIRWGITDFEHRFKRKPEGMWLPETAVDTETLDLMAQQGIRFTVLSPKQAHQIRPMDSEDWEDVSGGNLDPTTAYAVSLPSGQPFSIFFYDDTISSAVAFEGILNKGEVFANRLMSGFSDDRKAPQLIHIATDGESYGHHHPHGDMALSYALHYITTNDLAKITNYGEFLAKHPPRHEVRIFENSSWSCVHGVKRWRENCGCNSGGNPGWQQNWRKPLRAALDMLRDVLVQPYEHQLNKFCHDPWEMRNDYIRVILDRTTDTIEKFLKQHAKVALKNRNIRLMLKLLELQRNAMLMYTSCGWFFDEISGIETVQIIQYAGRVLQIAKDVFGMEIEPVFLEFLEEAPGNTADYENGRSVYEKCVKPAMVDLEGVCAHYAISTLFKTDPGSERIYCYHVEQEAYHMTEVGNTKLNIGQALIRSDITLENARYCYGILHWGDHNISGCIRACSHEEFNSIDLENLFDTFSRGAFPETLQLLEKSVGKAEYSLRALFRDQQRLITEKILSSTLENTTGIYHQIYDANVPLLRFLNEAGIPKPKALLAAAEYVLQKDFESAVEADIIDMKKIEQTAVDAKLAGVSINTPRLEITIRRRLEKIAVQLNQEPTDDDIILSLDAFLSVLARLPLKLNLRKVQNHLFELLTRVYPEFKQKVRNDQASKDLKNWIGVFESICRKLKLEVSEPV